MSVITFHGYRGASSVVQVTLDTTRNPAPSPSSSRPGAARRARMEASTEGRAQLAAARKVIGDALIADGIAPLAALRMKAGLSQGKVAELTGIQQPMLSRIENGRVPDPQVSTVTELSRVYRVSLDEFAAALNATVDLANK